MTLTKTLLALGASLLIARATPAVAAEATITHEEEDRRVAVTISPVHLVLPFFEVTGEVRAHRKLGIAAILGGGRVDEVDLYEVGSQVSYYLIGSFDHGMQIGVEGLYVHGDAAEDGVSAVARGLAVGPYVGYKIATRIGFTFNAQLGVQAAVIKAEASSGTATAMAEDEDVFPLLNLNVGWSF